MQSAITLNDAVLLFLDTNRPEGEAGDYGPERLVWLRDELAAAGSKPVYIFMHHPPVRTGFFIDHTMVQQADMFLQLVLTAGNVRHMFFGHVHRASSGNCNGITWSSLHGLASQNDFELLPAKPNYRSGPAQIGILLIDGGNSILHFQELLDSFPIVAQSGRSLRQP